jgi:hypothetical protein
VDRHREGGHVTRSRGRDLPPHMATLVDRELAKELDGGRLGPVGPLAADDHGPLGSSPPHGRSPYTGKGGKKGMSKTEQRFETLLHEKKKLGTVSGWLYEVVRVGLPAKRATAKPDFAIRSTGAFGHYGLVIVEVKPESDGKPYFGPRGRLKIKLVAERLAPIGVPVMVAWPSKDTVTGWALETIEAAS